MTLITDTIVKLQKILEHTGCEDGVVSLATVQDTVPCQFERGACLRASFGGKSADFMTANPVRATTRISFMYGKTLEKPEQRVAALAIMNVVAGFLCISRISHPCRKEDHSDCCTGLLRELAGRRVFIIGPVTPALKGLGLTTAPAAGEADIVIVTGDGLAYEDPAVLSLKKPVLFLGSSAAGLCSIGKHPHWCPFGTG